MSPGQHGQGLLRAHTGELQVCVSTAAARSALSPGAGQRTRRRAPVCQPGERSWARRQADAMGHGGISACSPLAPGCSHCRQQAPACRHRQQPTDAASSWCCWSEPFPGHSALGSAAESPQPAEDSHGAQPVEGCSYLQGERWDGLQGAS